MWHTSGLGTSSDVELLALSGAIDSIRDILSQIREVHLYSDSIRAICWLFDASSHSSVDCSLTALWAIWLWLDFTPDTKVFFHHVNKDIGLDTHSLVHTYATSVRVEAVTSEGLL